MIKSVRIQFDKLLHDTGKAILIRIYGQEHWIPKKLCRNLVTNNKLGGNVCIPTFIAERMGIDVNNEQPDVTIIHNIPEPKDKSEIKHDNSLFKINKIMETQIQGNFAKLPRVLIGTAISIEGLSPYTNTWCSMPIGINGSFSASLLEKDGWRFRTRNMNVYERTDGCSATLMPIDDWRDISVEEAEQIQYEFKNQKW